LAASTTGVTGTSGTSGQNSEKNTKTVTSRSLQDQFMQILLTELRYQDPMSPMQEKDFFGQMAQFTSATQMEVLNGKVDQVMLALAQAQTSQNLLGAARLIGSAFEAKMDNRSIRGVVESVALSNGKVAVRSGDILVPIENLLSIGGPGDAP